MILTIIDWRGEQRLIQTDVSKKIEKIKVAVVTGDEMIDIYYTDGTFEFYDASMDRLSDFFDCEYEASPENIEIWGDSAYNADSGLDRADRYFQAMETINV